MNGYGKNGSDYEKSQAGETDTARKIKQMAESREFLKNTASLIGNRRMRRDKKDGRSMER